MTSTQNRTAERIAVTHLLLRTTFALMLIGFLGGLGQIWILTMEVGIFAFGVGATAGSVGATKVIIALHALGVFALGTALYLWHRGDDWLPRFLRPIALTMLLFAPAGLPVSVMLWWLARTPERDEAMEHVPLIAGNRRAGIIVAWVAASFATLLLGWRASMLAETPAPIALAGGIIVGIPQALSLIWFLGAFRTRLDEPEHALPPLPEMHG